MKNMVAATAITCAFASLGSVAIAGQNEVFVLGSTSELNDTFFMGSYKRIFNNGNGSNVGFVLGVTASSVKYFDGTSNVNLVSQRVLAGYRMNLAPNASTTLSLGYDNVSSTGQSGAMVALEHWQGFSNGNSFFVSVEASNARNSKYVSANYSFGFKGFSVGPAISYFNENIYTATEYGVQGNIDLGSGLSLMPAIMYRNSQSTGNPSRSGVVGTLGLFASF